MEKQFFAQGGAQPLQRRRCLVWAAAGLVAGAGLATRAAQAADTPLPAGARSIRISQAQLQQAVAAKFPLARSWQGMVVIQLQKPSVQLLAASNSLRAAFDIWVTEKLMGNEYPGQMTLDFGLAFQDADASIRLHNVRVQQLQMQGVPAAYQGMFQTYAPRLAEQVLQGLLVYELPASQRMLLQGLGYTVERMEVQEQGLRIVLAPKTATAAPAR
ncbi:DUF1439 domain-containing protein [Comamonas sp. B-9]|uniref:DUF1439 domain-containing protein n=1 Tax=Comamonas sp. B-9 TaxID=1055192 RepID=UPI0003955613|nr:DUF1439 domain-containing protein [Comamonas sp. B-9]